MSNYSVLCIGCNKPFGLICKNCEHNQFTDTSKNPSKKSIQCNKCGKKVAGIKHKCWAFWSDPKPKTTYVNHNPERFTNLSQSSFTPKHSKEKGVSNDSKSFNLYLKSLQCNTYTIKAYSEMTVMDLMESV